MSFAQYVICSENPSRRVVAPEGQKLDYFVPSFSIATALALIEEFVNKHGKDVFELEDAKLLPVTTLRALCHWKLQEKANGKKDYLLNLWMQVKKNSPPSSSWSNEEETLLKKLKEDNIELKETALGRARSKLQEQSVASFLSMTEEERIASNLTVEILDGLKSTVAEI